MGSVASWIQKAREELVERGMLQFTVRLSPHAQEENIFNMDELNKFIAVSVTTLTVNDDAYEAMARIIAFTFDISAGSVKILRKWVDQKNNRMVDVLIKIE